MKQQIIFNRRLKYKVKLIVKLILTNNIQICFAIYTIQILLPITKFIVNLSRSIIYYYKIIFKSFFYKKRFFFNKMILHFRFNYLYKSNKSILLLLTPQPQKNKLKSFFVKKKYFLPKRNYVLSLISHTKIIKLYSFCWYLNSKKIS